MLHIGFAVRLLYFLLAPFTVLSAGDVIPMTGVLINIIVLVGGFIAVELLRDATGRHPLIARVLDARAPQPPLYPANRAAARSTMKRWPSVNGSNEPGHSAMLMRTKLPAQARRTSNPPS